MNADPSKSFYGEAKQSLVLRLKTIAVMCQARNSNILNTSIDKALDKIELNPKTHEEVNALRFSMLKPRWGAWGPVRTRWSHILYRNLTRDTAHLTIFLSGLAAIYVSVNSKVDTKTGIQTTEIKPLPLSAGVTLVAVSLIHSFHHASKGIEYYWRKLK